MNTAGAPSGPAVIASGISADPAGNPPKHAAQREAAASSHRPAGNERPLSVTVIGWIYIVTGAAAFAFHASNFHWALPVEWDILWVLLVELLAILGGIGMLRGEYWARWLAIAWIAGHVVRSAFGRWPELLVHGLMLAVLGGFLFRPRASAYFRHARAGLVQTQNSVERSTP